MKGLVVLDVTFAIVFVFAFIGPALLLMHGVFGPKIPSKALPEAPRP